MGKLAEGECSNALLQEPLLADMLGPSAGVMHAHWLPSSMHIENLGRICMFFVYSSLDGICCSSLAGLVMEWAGASQISDRGLERL